MCSLSRQVRPLLHRMYLIAAAAIVVVTATAALSHQADRRDDLAVRAAFRHARLGREVEGLAFGREERLRSFALRPTVNAATWDDRDRRRLFAKLDTLARATSTSADKLVVRQLRNDLVAWDSMAVRSYATNTVDSAQIGRDAPRFARIREHILELRQLDDSGFAEAPDRDKDLRTTWIGSVVIEYLCILAGAFFAHRIVVRQVGVVVESQYEMLDRLAAAGEYRDDATGQHTQRVGELAARIAQTMGLDAERVTTIRRAAPLHDVGKIGVPDSILLKPGKLTAREMDVLRQHTIIGARILEGSRLPVVAAAAVIARSHHERWDGTGYPDRLKGDQIPLEARITAVADVFDAIRSKRPYRDAWALEVCLEEIRIQAGRQFDPAVVNAFFQGRCHEGYAVQGGHSQDASVQPKLLQSSAPSLAERQAEGAGSANTSVEDVVTEARRPKAAGTLDIVA